MDDVISRRAVVECVYKALRTPPLKGVFTDTMSLAISMVNDLPSADSPEDKWIPIKWHTITEEEREQEGYPKEWVTYLDCEMPEDGQEILVTTKYGYVEKDVCYLDDGYSLDSGWDWIEDIVAWMPLPPVYQEEDSK